MQTLWLSRLALVLIAAHRHPIHAARVELDVTPSGTINATVHVYRDDLPAGADIANVEAALDRGIVLSDAHGVRVSLRVITVVSEGDRMRIALGGTARGGVAHGTIAVPLLQDRFSDQVNVVQVTLPRGHAQLVFLRGDRPQVLP